MTIGMQISPRLAKTAGASAVRSSMNFEDGSQLETSPSQEDVREIEWSDIIVGRTLGKGGFANANLAMLKSQDDRPYAIKYLRNSVVARKNSIRIGAADLVYEAKILQQLSHPNIISLHGISAGPLEESYLNNRRFFLLLDLLDYTLEDKLLEWGWEEEQLSVTQNRLLPRFGLPEAQKTRLYERMSSVAIPVAKALKYLHENNIIMRDLKPGNIGFQDGTVKLFDFGMAREIKEGRKLTGNTGSPLYMAPENFMSKNYGVEADIYSFGYVLWELATLKVPFEGYDREKHTRKVFVEDCRPRVDFRCGSTRMQQLISSCWDRSPKSRPSAFQVLVTLNVETSRKLGGSDDEQEPRRRFSKLLQARAA